MLKEGHTNDYSHTYKVLYTAAESVLIKFVLEGYWNSRILKTVAHNNILYIYIYIYM